MKKIKSFEVDHRRIVPGLYLSKIDGDVTTYDLRLKKPNMGDYITDPEMHSFEHMFATYIRNSEIADSVIYFGPMGCKTGFDLLVRNVVNEKVLKATIDSLNKIIAHEGDVFGASETECGNFRTLDINAAKKVASEYLEILKNNKNDFIYYEE